MLLKTFQYLLLHNEKFVASLTVSNINKVDVYPISISIRAAFMVLIHDHDLAMKMVEEHGKEEFYVQLCAHLAPVKETGSVGN